MQCEKCENAATTLVVDLPDYIHDATAGWFLCDDCFALDPDGWYEVLDARKIDTVDVLPAKAVKRRPASRARAAQKPRVKRLARASDDVWLEQAYKLHCDGMTLGDVAREVMKVRPYKNLESARESLRVNFKRREWNVSLRKEPVAA